MTRGGGGWIRIGQVITLATRLRVRRALVAKTTPKYLSSGTREVGASAIYEATLISTLVGANDVSTGFFRICMYMYG